MEGKPQEPQKYTIILYYKYTKIEDPEAFCKWNKEIGKKLGLTGRVIVALEGLNGTLEGTDENIEEFCKELRKIGTTNETLSMGNFSDIQIKTSAGTGKAFPKLRVRVRPEIVSLHLGDDNVDPNKLTGEHLPPEELKKWYEKNEDFIVVDMRNDYEFAVGRFKNSMNPDLENFRDLPKQLNKLENIKNKKVLTVCTGGVRCEKASGFLLKKGFKNVYQLDGGMHKYMEKFPGEDFLGTLYTFDNRIVMDFGDSKNGKREVVGRCSNCEDKCETFSHCGEASCYRHLVVCKSCLLKHGRIFCSLKCKTKYLFGKLLGRKSVPARLEN